MNGRIEHEEKMDSRVINRLENMPLFCSDWYSYLVASNLTAVSRNEYIKKIDDFMSYIDSSNKRNIDPKSITSAMVISYYGSKRYKIKDGLKMETSDSYKIQTWNCLNNFLNFLCDQGLIDKNYIKAVRKPSNKDFSKNVEKRIKLNGDDLKKILASVDTGAGTDFAKRQQEKWKNRDKSILLLFMMTGMREEALCEIDLQDIDFEFHKLKVTDKGDKEHIYYLKSDLENVIKMWIEDRKGMNVKNANALFLGKRGTRITAEGVTDIVKKYSKEGLGYSISPHKLRGAFITNIYEKTGNIEFARRAVGHSSLETTKRYIVTNGKEKEMAADIMSGILS